MPTLNWIGKDAVVNHDKEVPFRLLRKVKSASVGENSQNLIIHGDNLEALKALMPYYGGKVKCIYIDPPYNTGKENWVYNDKVNSPKIQKWLGKVVGNEAADLCRHDKWLCMMYPRLRLLYDLLSEDGVIFISIDDHEYQNLKHICDEIFGKKNFITNFTWRTDGNFDNQAKIKINHEYILCFAKDEELFKHPNIVDPNINENSKLFKPEIRNTIVKNGPKNPVSIVTLPKGFPAEFKKGTITVRNNAWPHILDEIIIDDFKLTKSARIASGWSSKAILESFINNNCNPVLDSKDQQTTFLITGNGTIENIKKRDQSSHVVSSLQNMGSTQNMSSILKSMSIDFDYPKPHTLIGYLITMIADKDCIVLDSFAGSGTTGHAVLDLNKADGGTRKFILVEIEDKVAKNVTAERVKRAINKYDYNDGFEYCELSKPLFNEEGHIEEECDFNQFATYIYFTETQTNIDPKAIDGNYIGEKADTEYYLIYKEKGKNVLDKSFFKKMRKNDAKKIIYADFCKLNEKILADAGIVFKQIPYEVKVY
jgi:adenine-specific DNA-methyltransferase